MKTIKKAWELVANCKCGWTKHCSHGSLFHLTYKCNHIEVCPKCGEHKDNSMKVVTARAVYIKRSWWRPTYFSHWEFKSDRDLAEGRS